jgi:hypothetical protein
MSQAGCPDVPLTSLSIPRGPVDSMCSYVPAISEGLPGIWTMEKHPGQADTLQHIRFQSVSAEVGG